MSRRALLAWSGGKDSAHALQQLRAAGDVEICGLLTTVRETDGSISIHEVSAELLALQTAATGLQLTTVGLPDPCPNEVYQERMHAALRGARDRGIDTLAFGDLFLEDIRAFRERLLEGTGIAPAFPLWGRDTAALAREIVASGIRAVVTCVDTAQLDARFTGREVDGAFLDELPDGVDPCAENGEFHTFVCDGPGLRSPVGVRVGDVSLRGGFAVCELRPSDQLVRR